MWYLRAIQHRGKRHNCGKATLTYLALEASGNSVHTDEPPQEAGSLLNPRCNIRGGRSDPILSSTTLIKKQMLQNSGPERPGKLVELDLMVTSLLGTVVIRSHLGVQLRANFHLARAS